MVHERIKGMNNRSPFLAMQQVERQLKDLVRQIDVDSLNVPDKKALASIRQMALDAKLDIRDYELSETREEQIKKAHEARKRITELVAVIVATGYSFGPADVAQLSAQLDQIKGRLV